jgi:hydrogenase expression/formation protein HypE
MKNQKILLGHGSGGKLSHELLSRIFLPHFKNDELGRMNDAAVFSANGNSFAFTTDSYVVSPLFFPGGDIGRIAVCGTVNDLAMMGARPLCLSAGFILEEGFPLEDLEKIIESMRDAANEARVDIVTGDTKVVPSGAADKLFINTSGVGLVPPGVSVNGSNARIGDRIVVNGPLGEHGITVMAQREGLRLNLDLKSDAAPLNHLVAEMLKDRTGVHVLRDPTRGGIAATLNEIARQSRVGVKLYEREIPVGDSVQAACEILGLDPLCVANEGKLLAFCAAEEAGDVLAVMRGCTYGEGARIIGEVTAQPEGKVYMETLIGGRRIVDMPAGELLPRIC